MNHILDKIHGIPYYTNNTDQLFSWYSVYNDSVIITELNDYSNVDFNSVPKSNITNFGLFGCGFHLNCDFNTGELSMYQSYKENELLYTVTPTIQENKLLISNDKEKLNIVKAPFTFKHIVLETDFIDKTSSRCFIDQYYAGYSGTISLDESIQILFKIYFSIHIYDHPNSIGIIYKFFPYNNIKYPTKKYRFNLAENVYSNIDNINKTSQNSKTKLLDFNENKGYYKGKIILQL